MSEFRRRLMQGGKDYEIVDHILTNGLAYIDTGYFVNPNTEVELDCYVGTRGINNGGNNLFAATEGYTTYSTNHGASTVGAVIQNDAFYWCPKSLAGGGQVRNLSVTFNARVLIGIRREGTSTWYGYFGSNKTAALTGAPKSISNSLRLLANSKDVPYNVSTPLKFYSFKITENGEVIKHFVPAKKGDIYGMAEIIEGKFYQSPNGESFDY